ncbi:MAG: Methionyl-tRNA formyltransferase [Piccolia ochrophora]|nr:MAG: Methionyl-tRNA formyltransferase [Piccolia ochrophora]
MKLIWSSRKWPINLRRHLRPPTSYYYSSSEAPEPLRILFCGSDHFSISSLNALRQEQISQSKTIDSIDVVCKSGKRTGRGLREIREVPIKAAAEELDLPVHEIDTFRGWSPPVPRHGPINLLIAVSFGLFIPPRILQSAKYGGLNVHPSLLPEFRGAAPLHHTLLAGRRNTGITIQTLDAERFDHGRILVQTPAPGIEISNPDTCTVQTLENLLAPVGATMLVEAIRNKVYVPPLKEVEFKTPESAVEQLPRAPKIKPDDRRIQWTSWTAEEMLQRDRILGGLWTMGHELGPPGKSSLHGKRVLMHNIKPYYEKASGVRHPRCFYVGKDASRPEMVLLKTQDEQFLEVGELTVEGKPKVNAVQVAISSLPYLPWL